MITVEEVAFGKSHIHANENEKNKWFADMW